jgi:ATP-dependent protease HslVU (ClpYQ) peptidase subunit
VTTIAYRDGVLAGDGRTTVGDTVVSAIKKKVFRLRDGCLFGYSGSQEDGERLRHAIKTGAASPALENIQALLILVSGKIMLYEGMMWVHLSDPYTAIGTGTPYALTAMDCGLDAPSAVRMALKRDTASGGKVFTVELRE